MANFSAAEPKHHEKEVNINSRKTPPLSRKDVGRRTRTYVSSWKAVLLKGRTGLVLKGGKWF